MLQSESSGVTPMSSPLAKSEAAIARLVQCRPTSAPDFDQRTSYTVEAYLRTRYDVVAHGAR